MWKIISQRIEGQNVIQYQIGDGQQLLSYRDQINLWKSSSEFCRFFNQLLADCPFAGFFWEVKPIDENQLNDPFEFVLVDSSILPQIRSDRSAFSEYFQTDESVVSFPNIRGDAQLVVPTPIGDEDAYAHLGAFVRAAPGPQTEKLWRMVGETYEKMIGANMKWLSTAGLGVYWLHVRVDSVPKYYRYRPYKLGER